MSQSLSTSYKLFVSSTFLNIRAVPMVADFCSTSKDRLMSSNAKYEEGSLLGTVPSAPTTTGTTHSIKPSTVLKAPCTDLYRTQPSHLLSSLPAHLHAQLCQSKDTHSSPRSPCFDHMVCVQSLTCSISAVASAQWWYHWSLTGNLYFFARHQCTAVANLLHSDTM